ncbi:MAG: peptidyl-prolyl cis-trans isomerase [Acidobacteria bacterium]|nr:MAG: peptidyl-prolyl cis-trans isomerase [Acidobacteriota bacterium]
MCRRQKSPAAGRRAFVLQAEASVKLSFLLVAPLVALLVLGAPGLAARQATMHPGQHGSGQHSAPSPTTGAPDGRVAPADAVVLASSALGGLEARELLSELRHLSRDERQFRQHAGHSRERIASDLLRRIALRRWALTDPANDHAGRAARRGAAIAAWRSDCYGLEHGVPTVEQLVAELEPVSRSRRIRLSHIFRRAETSEQIAAAVAELEALRSEIAGYEQFGRFARERSDSLTARRQGRLGTLREEWLQPGMEVLFEVGEGSMSAPLPLRGGVHLFWVEQKHPAEIVPALGRARRIHRERALEARQRCRETRLASLAQRPSPPAPDWKELRVGDWRIERSELAALHPELDPASGSAILTLLEDEALYQLAQRLGAFEGDEEARLDIIAGNAALDAAMDRRVQARLQPIPEAEITAHLTENTYRTTRRIAARYLSTPVPDGEDPIVFLDELQAFAAGLAAGESTWDDAGARLAGGPAGQELELTDVRDAAALLSPAVFDSIARLEVGGVGEPVHQDGLFWVVQVTADEPAETMTGEAARERARQVMRATERRRLRARLSTLVLEEIGFELTATPEQLAALVDRARALASE